MKGRQIMGPILFPVWYLDVRQVQTKIKEKLLLMHFIRG
jgi:hypothetical protein